MNIPNMINTLISEAFEIKPVLSPKTREIPKSPNSKAKLRNFVLPGHSQHKKEVTSPASKSISQHKLSGEYTQKDISSTKNNQSLDQNSYNKIFEAKKEAKKSSNIILASFLKNNALKPSLAGANPKQGAVETVVFDLKTATLRNPTRTSYASPYNKRASPVPNMKEMKVTSESVTQLQSPKAKNGDFSGLIHGEKEQSALKSKLVITKANNQDSEFQVKKMSPKRLKAKEDRTGISEVLYDSKRHFKRKSVYRSRQSSNLTETMDDPASKLSTNALSQFSEARRSIPSQKSQSLIKQNHNETTINDEGKDFISSRQKIRHNTEIKFNESYDNNGNQNVTHKSKQPSMKEKPAIKIEAKLKQVTRNEARVPKSMDGGGAYGKLLKTFYMQKKNELRKSKILKATSSHVSFLKEDGHLGSFYKEQIRNLLKNNCDMKGIRERPGLRLETRTSDPKSSLLLNVSSNRNLVSPNARDIDRDLLYDVKRMTAKNVLRRELRKTKSLSPPKMKIYTEGISALQPQGSELFDCNSGKNILKETLSLRSAAPFKGISAMENKAAHPQEEKEEHSESGKECSLHTSTYEIPTESNLSVANRNNERSSDGLYRIYQKTRNILENYRVKENSWTNEKSLMLEHIQNLENKLKAYVDKM